MLQVLFTVSQGTLVPMGTVDFYVNGGEDQPSCANSVIGRVSAFFNTLGSGFDSMRTALGCSHMRATQLFMQSVNHVCGWPTYLCPDQDSLQQDQCTPCDTGQCHGMGYNLVYQSVLHSSVCYRTNTPELFPFC
uniref:Lipase domain-containing protein n=1 Tax=Biomphalaria glabrata TaxID=6526 RepID=A0A2C9L3V0_BIOGL